MAAAAGGPDDWVEEAFAGGYYYELWRRVGRSGGDALALRAVDERDALIVVAGGRFAYVVARATAPQALGDEYASTAAYVDAALAQKRRGDAEAMLGLEAGWGARRRGGPAWREGCARSSGVAFRVVESAATASGAAAGGEVGATSVACFSLVTVSAASRCHGGRRRLRRGATRASRPRRRGSDARRRARAARSVRR